MVEKRLKMEQQSLEELLKDLQLEMERIERFDIETYDMAKDTIRRLLEAIQFLL
jgi:hypothetical protein